MTAGPETAIYRPTDALAIASSAGTARLWTSVRVSPQGGRSAQRVS